MKNTQKTRFSYKGLENLDKSYADRPAFVRFQVVDSATGATIIDFYTNKALEGVFEYDQDTANYRQLIGTMGFRVPSAKSSARRALRRLALASMAAGVLCRSALASMADFPHTTRQ